MRVLITGGAGFIGGHLAECLLKRGDEVYVIDDLSTGSFQNIAHLEKNRKFHLVIDSVLNKPIVGKLVDLSDQVFHLAAAVGVRTIIEHPMQSLNTNIVGTENVLEAANKKKKKVFIASTSEVYGKSMTQEPFKETDDRVQGPTHISRWGYAASKAIDEFMAFSYYREKKLPTVTARLFNVIGPRQTGQYGMVVPNFIQQALRNLPITIFGSGLQSRCFCYIDDVIQAIVKLMSSRRALGEMFNIASKTPITIEDLARKIKKMTRSTSKITKIPYREAYNDGFEDMMHRSADITKIRRFVGWQPSTSLDVALRKIIEHFDI